MMNKTIYHQTAFAALILSLAIQPLSAGPVVVTPSGQSAVPGAASSLPLGAVNTNLGGSGAFGTVSRFDAEGNLTLPQTLVWTQPDASAVQVGARGGSSALSAEAAPLSSFASPRSAVAPLGSRAASLRPGTLASQASREVAGTGIPANGISAPSRGKTLLGRLLEAVTSRNSDVLFDGSKAAAPMGVVGILPTKPLSGIEGIKLDPAPTTPDPKSVKTVEVEDFRIFDAARPGSKQEGAFESRPIPLKADPSDIADVERALRKLIDGAPNSAYGVGSQDLATIHIRRIEGKGDQADTIYAYFHQQKDGLEVHGSYLSFTVKIIQGRSYIMATAARLYPQMSVRTTQKMTDAELLNKAEQRVFSPDNVPTEAHGQVMDLIGRKIVHVGMAWRAVNLYAMRHKPVMIAVDIGSGQAFAWDPRVGTLSSGGVKGKLSGKVQGRGIEKGPTRPDSDVKPIPLAHLSLRLGKGKAVVTDSEGRFISESSQEGGVEFKGTLTGPYVSVRDSNGKNLSVSGSLVPGEEARITFNPKGADERDIAQVNAFRLVNQVHDWLKAHGIDEKKLDVAIPVETTIDDDCNAYYTPGRPSLNFFRSNGDCSNTAYDTVVLHEYGHFADDMIGGIINGGLSEGWGDIFSMYILGNPIIGEGFFKVRQPDYIRHGENTYQFGEDDEVHAQGQAWMGFAWKMRKAMMAALGDAPGATLAETLVVPTMYAKAATIPAAMAQVLLNDMSKDGSLPHEKFIRAAAKAHGVTLPKKPSLLTTIARQVVDWFFGPPAVHGETRIENGLAGRMSFAAEAAESRQIRAKTRFSAGMLTRGQVERKLRSFLETQEGITYELKEFKGWFESDYVLVIDGPKDKALPVMRAVVNWLRSIAQS